MKIIEFAKDRPYVTAGVVFVGGLVLILAFSGGTPSEDVEPSLGGYTGPDNSAAIAANSMLAQSQLAGQVASRISDNERAIAENDNETAYRIAAANFERQNNADVLTARVAMAASDNETTRFREAQVTSLGIARAQAESATNIANIAANKERFIAQQAANVQHAQIRSESDAALHALHFNRERELHALNLGYNLNRELGIHKMNVDAGNQLQIRALELYSDRYIAGVTKR